MSRTTRLIPEPAGGTAQPGRRWPFACGPRFFLLLALGLLWLAPAILDARFAWMMIAWDIGLVTAWAADHRRLPAPGRLCITRLFTDAPALSSPAEVTIEARNESRTNLYLTIIDDVPASLRREPPVLAFDLPARGSARGAYTIEPLERGDIGLGRVHLRYRSPLRLAERWACADLSQTITVLPDLAGSRRQTLYLIRSRQTTQERRLRRQRGRGSAFESLRESRPGDPWRDICWTASARRGKLISKVYEVERSQVVWIILDTGRLLRERVGPLCKLDHAVNAGLSLAQAAVHAGDRVGLLVYGRRVIARRTPGRGAAHLRGLAELLSQPRADAREADHRLAAHELLRLQRRRALVVWITDLAETATTPGVIRASMRMARRHLVLLVVIGQPDFGRLLGTRPDDAAAMYRLLAAQEVAHRREGMLQELRHRGVLAIESHPAGLSAAIVSRYLEVKDRGLL